eukprot:4386377-Pleurochrysis_carterae.AAC.1
MPRIAAYKHVSTLADKWKKRRIELDDVQQFTHKKRTGRREGPNNREGQGVVEEGEKGSGKEREEEGEGEGEQEIRGRGKRKGRMKAEGGG